MFKLNIPNKSGEIITRSVYSVDEIIAGNRFSRLPALFITRPRRGNKERKQFINCPVAFDIETSRVNQDGHTYSFMYHWQMTICGVLVFGRTWEEFDRILCYLHSVCRLDEHRIMTIYVQNLGYEFAFFYSRFPLGKIFARSAHYPIEVNLTGDYAGFRFRCSYYLSGYDLYHISVNTASCPYIKDKEEIDYNVVRTATTELSATEQMYCAKDVLILHYYIKECIQREKTHNIAYIPLTKTGYIRRECRTLCQADNEWMSRYKRLQLSGEAFIMYRCAFRGGDVHGNLCHIGDIVEDCYSFDITSSYPTQMLLERYPASAPNIIHQPTIKEWQFIRSQNWLHLIDITLENVHIKSIEHYDYIPYAKCLSSIVDRTNGDCIDNGRIYRASAIRICVTSIDFEIIERNYDFDVARIHRILYHRRSELLPLAFRDYIVELYRNKTTLKSVPDKATEYQQSKANLNSLYGCCVTSPLQDTVDFNEDTGEWSESVLQIKDTNTELIDAEMQKYYRSRSNFLSYSDGVFVTAYARKMLHNALNNIPGYDVVYCDTDSVKFTDADNKQAFNEINDDISQRFRALGYNIDDISPADIKGNRHHIGLWDDEHPNGFAFKTFGAKKYFCQSSEFAEVTVAGLNKKKSESYLQEKYSDILKVEIGETFDELSSGRTYSEYHAEPFTIDVNGEIVHEESYVNIMPTTYTLDMTEEHKMLTIIEKCKINWR